MDAPELIAGVRAGDRRALARSISHVEADTVTGRALLAGLYPHTGRAQTIGVTGSAGVGKSTFVAALAREQRRRGHTVGIVAVDPSSPFSNGAILGDRIRMQDLTSDGGVFMRSMASRGNLGGLSEMATGVVDLMDAAGFDVVILETVGAGQDEVEVATATGTTILVTTPAGGDDIQSMKAGLMEIAEIMVVNKADIAGADTAVMQLRCPRDCEHAHLGTAHPQDHGARGQRPRCGHRRDRSPPGFSIRGSAHAEESVGRWRRARS
ncbi:MAG: methylmalonyl Co-A mutase-associated GTPase MeaB [Dehalococcoidia bacterium]